MRGLFPLPALVPGTSVFTHNRHTHQYLLRAAQHWGTLLAAMSIAEARGRSFAAIVHSLCRWDAGGYCTTMLYSVEYTYANTRSVGKHFSDNLPQMLALLSAGFSAIG